MKSCVVGNAGRLTTSSHWRSKNLRKENDELKISLVYTKNEVKEKRGRDLGSSLLSIQEYVCLPVNC